jgi:type IV pilus assembly protein PilM
MKSILSKAKLGSQPGGRPPAAVEIAPQGVLAAALPAPWQPTAYAFQPLAAGALMPGIGEPNLRAPEAVAAAIRSTLGQVSPRTRAVTLVVPDTVVRVFVLDFDSLPGKAAEAYSVLRFRLRKMVPFDVEHAGLSYQVLVEKKTECKVLAAVLRGTSPARCCLPAWLPWRSSIPWRRR